MTYNIQYSNKFVVNSPQRPIFNITKDGLFYHDMRNLLKNKNTEIRENDPRSPIPQVEEKNKQYTACDVKRADWERQYHHITGQLIKWILHTDGNNIVQNLPIFQNDIGMAEDIYWPSVPYLQVKIVWHKIQHVETIMVPSVPTEILDKCKKVIIYFEILHINGIGSMNTKPWHVMFSTVSIIKIEK